MELTKRVQFRFLFDQQFLDVYGDYDWFEQVSLDHFR